MEEADSTVKRSVITNEVEPEEFEDNRYDEDVHETDSEVHGDEQFEKDFADDAVEFKQDTILFNLPQTPQKSQREETIEQEEEEVYPTSGYSDHYIEDSELILMKKKSKKSIKIPLLAFFLFLVFALDAVSVHTVDSFMPSMLANQFKIPSVDIGLYMGFLGSAYYVANFVSHVYFGYLSDRFGRKSFLTLSLIVNSIAIALFGFSSTYWDSFLVRVLQGLLSSASVLVKSSLIDISNSTNRSAVIAYFGAVQELSRSLSGAIGGILVGSQQVMSMLQPYAFACSVAAVICSFGVFLVFYLPETNSKEKRQMDASEFESQNNTDLGFLTAIKVIFSSITTIAVFTMYFLVALGQQMHIIIWILLFNESIGNLGFQFNAIIIGLVIGLYGLAGFLIQIASFQLFYQALGLRKLFIIGCVISSIQNFVFPLIPIPYWINNFSRNTLTDVFVGFALIILTVTAAAGKMFTKSIASIMIVNATPLETQGLVQGLVGSTSTFTKAVAPLLAGIIYTLTIRFKGHFILFFLNGLLFIIPLAISCFLNKTVEANIKDHNENLLYSSNQEKPNGGDKLHISESYRNDLKALKSETAIPVFIFRFFVYVWMIFFVLYSLLLYFRYIDVNPSFIYDFCQRNFGLSFLGTLPLIGKFSLFQLFNVVFYITAAVCLCFNSKGKFSSYNSFIALYPFAWYSCMFIVERVLIYYINDNTCNTLPNSISSNFHFYIFITLSLLAIGFKLMFIDYEFEKKPVMKVLCSSTSLIFLLFFFIGFICTMLTLIQTYIEGFQTLRQIIYGTAMALVSHTVMISVLSLCRVEEKEDEEDYNYFVVSAFVVLVIMVFMAFLASIAYLILFPLSLFLTFAADLVFCVIALIIDGLFMFLTQKPIVDAAFEKPKPTEASTEHELEEQQATSNQIEVTEIAQEEEEEVEIPTVPFALHN